MIDLHGRQPLVLARGDWERWLAGEKLVGSLHDFARHPVSLIVNSPRNDVPECLDPVEDVPLAQRRLFE